MARVKIWHYRDHLNGALLDGNVYINTNTALDASVLQTHVKCRFRLAGFGFGTPVQSVWGMGNGNDAYSLKIYADSGRNHLRIRYLNKDYDYPDLDINLDEIYNVTVNLTTAPNIVLNVRDQYNNPVYYESRAMTSIGTLASSNLFVGATSDSAGNPQQHFVGTLFDFWYYKASTYRRLVFYKNYSGVGDATIGDFFGNRNAAVCGTIPWDFWPEMTDISDGVTDITQLRHQTDSFRTPVLTDMSFVCYGTHAIRINDTIGLEDTDSAMQNWFYRVYRTEELTDGLTRIYCESIFTALEQVRSCYFLTSTDSFPITRTDWWSNLTPVFFTGSNYSTTEYHFDVGVSSKRWVTALYVLKSVLYFLQYDNILSVDISAIVDAASDFRSSSNTLSYKWFAIGHYCMSYAGRGNKEDNDSADMASLFRELLLGLRLTFLIEDSIVKYRKVNYGSAAIGDDSNYDYRQSVERQRKYYQVNRTRLSSGIDYWDGWTSTDSEEVSASNISSAYKVRNSVIDVSLTNHFLIQRHGSSSNAITDLSPSFEAQLADILDRDFRRDIPYANIKTGFVAAMDERYIRKIDDLKNQTSEIKQEA